MSKYNTTTNSDIAGEMFSLEKHNRYLKLLSGSIMIALIALCSILLFYKIYTYLMVTLSIGLFIVFILVIRWRINLKKINELGSRYYVS